MSQPPAHPKIYHITHVDNLTSIAEDGELLSDAAMIATARTTSTIGMSAIKKRRLTLPVRCHPDDKVGDFVPFNFCPRSVMLYVISRANHEDLEYRGGQGPIVHLQADLHEVIEWAEESSTRWAFSLSNASTYYAEFRKREDELDQVDWEAVKATEWRNVKEEKQAKFLAYGSFPWELVTRIGVKSADIQGQAEAAIMEADHAPAVVVKPAWYY